MEEGVYVVYYSTTPFTVGVLLMIDNKILARIKIQLGKTACFKCGVMSYTEFFINHVSRVESVISNNECNFNRRKFNRMDNNKDQDKYLEKLKAPVTKYRAYIKGGDSWININKLLFMGFKMISDGRMWR